MHLVGFDLLVVSIKWMRACVYIIQLIETFFVGISHFIMDSESECAVAVIIVAAISKKRKRIRKKRLRSIWVKPWLGRRNDLGVDNTLLREFRLEDSDEYKKFLRVSPENFDELLGPFETPSRDLSHLFMSQ